jgi:hypothetical protein
MMSLLKGIGFMALVTAPLGTILGIGWALSVISPTASYIYGGVIVGAFLLYVAWGVGEQL